jgi:hypothetical protein
MKLLHALGDEAAGPGGVQRASFVASALGELSVGLCRGNFFMYRACLGMVAKSMASGTGFRAGMRVPTTSMGCCRIPAGYVLFVPVLFMWNVVVLLLMHLLGAADCVVASYVFVIIIFIYIFEGPNTEFHQPLHIIRVSR